MKNSYYIALLAILWYACTFIPTPQPDEKVLARAYNEYLYAQEVQEILPENISEKDSAEYVRQYIENWIARKALTRKAHLNLPENIEKEIQKKAQEYIDNLYIHYYENELVKQKLDTSIEKAEIIEYYENYKENFTLQENIMQILFLKTAVNSPDLKNVTNWFSTLNEENYEQLKEYCYKYAIKCNLDTTLWLSEKTLKKEIPLDSIEQYPKKLQQKKLIQYSDSLYVYYLLPFNYITQNKIAPLPYVENKIVTLLLNRRKQMFIERMKLNIVENAKNKNEVEILY